MKKAVDEVHIYPDGASWKLRNALAAKFDLEMGNFIMGCGSNEELLKSCPLYQEIYRTQYPEEVIA